MGVDLVDGDHIPVEEGQQDFFSNFFGSMGMGCGSPKE